MGIHQLKEQNSHMKQRSVHCPVLNLKAPSLVNTQLTSVNSEKSQEPSRSIFPKTGWLSHYSDKDPKVQRHFWKVDHDFITLHLTENGSLLYKKIAVRDIVSLKELKVSKKDVQHTLKLLLDTEQLYFYADNKDQARNRAILRSWSNAIKLSQEKFQQKTANAEKSSKKEKSLFDNCQFALDFQNATNDANKQLRRLITSNGGQISYILTKNTNYLLLCHEEKTNLFKTHKAQKATSLGIPIVTGDFVETCFRKGELVDCAEFVLNSSICGDFSKGKISAPVRQRKVKQKAKFDIENIVKYKIDSGDCPVFPKKFQVPRYALFSLSSVDNHSITAVACVEVQVAASCDEDKMTKFRVVVSGSGESGKSCYVYPLSDVAEAVNCYELLVEKYVATGMKRIYGLCDDELCSIISEPLALILSEIKTSSGIIHPQVIRLVERIWMDSLGELNMLMDVDPASVTLDQIRNALIALLKIENSIEEDSFKNDLSNMFYKFLPHKPDHKELIDSISKVAKKRELCQLLKDIASVNETSWLLQGAGDIQSQYTALKCAMIWLDPSGSEYEMVKDLLPGKAGSSKFHLKNIFRVNCNAESMGFKSKVGNVKLLFHSSSSQNFVGIFSRGLLLPHEVTKTLGTTRRDVGNLGAGIYFTDSFHFSCEFTSPSQVSGSRLVLVNEVALGKVFETYKTMPEITASPEGFDSVKWVKNADEKRDAKTQDNEYAVYDRNQQRICYVLEFTMDDEVMTSRDSLPVTMPSMRSISELNIMNASSHSQENLNPVLKEVTYGLVMESESPAPKLDEVHIRAKIIDLVSEVIVFQAYINESTKTVEAKYVFPLMKDAAVCGFEAYINEKHVIGIVKEKEQAHREYKEAVSSGHGAYLMDEEKPNVFSVSIGNIPSHARVVIKITYVCELEVVNEPHSCVSFSLPGNISELDKQSALLNSDITQITTDSFVVSKGDKSSLLLSVDMPYDIIDITSPSHKILVKKTATKACVKLQKSTNLGSECFNLFIQVAEIHVPRIWIEKLEPGMDGQVAMVTFFPEFDFAASDDFDCTILLDMSNSMSGLASHVRYLCSMLIDLLPSECHFKVIAFGSHFEENSVGFKKAGADAKEIAKKFVTQCSPSLGGSDILYLLNSISLMQDPKSRQLHNIFLFSDGHLTEEERLLKTASLISAKSRSFTRIFTCAIGDSPNSHTLQSLSLLSGGSYEHFSPSIKTSWRKQLQNQLVNSKQPVLTDVYIDWSNDDDALKDSLQVPEKMKCVFNGSRLVAYSFLPNCAQATLHATICGRKFSTVITAHDLCKITGRTLHRLAVKNVFKEHETGILAEGFFDDQMLREGRKTELIALSIRYSVVSKFTSFIAVEKREENEEMRVMTGPTMGELLQSSFVDIISEVSWGVEDMTVEENVENLIRNSFQIETSSVLQARQLAIKAKTIYDNVPKRDAMQNLLISARLCELDVTQDKFNPWHSLTEVLLSSDGMLNYGTLNTILRSNDSRFVAALRVLISQCWPDHCSVSLASIHPKLQPLLIGACVAFHHTNPDILKGHEDYMNFMEYFKSKIFIPKLHETEVTDETTRSVARKTGALIKKLHSFHVRRRLIESQAEVESKIVDHKSKFAPPTELHRLFIGSTTVPEQKPMTIDVQSSNWIAKTLVQSTSHEYLLKSMSKLDKEKTVLVKLRRKKSSRALPLAEQSIRADECAEATSVMLTSQQPGVLSWHSESPSRPDRLLKTPIIPPGASTISSLSYSPSLLQSRSRLRIASSMDSSQQSKVSSWCPEVPPPSNQSASRSSTNIPSPPLPSSRGPDVLRTSFLSKTPNIPPRSSSIIPLSRRLSQSSIAFSRFKGSSRAERGDVTQETSSPIHSSLENANLLDRCSLEEDKFYMESEETDGSYSIRKKDKMNLHADLLQEDTSGNKQCLLQRPLLQCQAAPAHLFRGLSSSYRTLKNTFGGGSGTPASSRSHKIIPTAGGFGTVKLGLFGTSKSTSTSEIGAPMSGFSLENYSETSDVSSIGYMAKMKTASDSPFLHAGGILSDSGAKSQTVDEIKSATESKTTVFDGLPKASAAGSLFDSEVKQVSNSSLPSTDSVEEADTNPIIYENMPGIESRSRSENLFARKKKSGVRSPNLLETSSHSDLEEEKLLWSSVRNMPQSIPQHRITKKTDGRNSRESSATKEYFNSRLVQNVERNIDRKKSSTTLHGFRQLFCGQDVYDCLDLMGDFSANSDETDDDSSSSVTEHSDESSGNNTPSSTGEFDDHQTERHYVFSLMSWLKLDADRVQESIHSRLSASGQWKFHESDVFPGGGSELIRLLSISGKNLIVDSGGRSLGAHCMSVALDMLLTSVFLEILEALLKRSSTETSHETIALAKAWLKKMDESHPSLYTRLELGSSWKIASNRVIIDASAYLLCDNEHRFPIDI